MRPLITAALTLALLIAPVEAQWDAIPLLIKGQPTSITVSVGDLKGQPIPLPVMATAAFLIRWARGTSEAVPVMQGSTFLGTTRAVPLGLPVGTLRLQVETAGRAQVQVETCAAALAPLTCPMVVDLQRAAPDSWAIAGVRVP
jgi:hypothetical protein